MTELRREGDDVQAEFRGEPVAVGERLGEVEVGVEEVHGHLRRVARDEVQQGHALRPERGAGGERTVERLPGPREHLAGMGVLEAFVQSVQVLVGHAGAPFARGCTGRG